IMVEPRDEGVIHRRCVVTSPIRLPYHRFPQPEPRRRTMPSCAHANQIHEVHPSAKGCEDCLKIGDSWVHLRLCLTCGHVGCCDSSKNKHATKHFHAVAHPLVRSLERGDDWLWCYVDEVMMEPG